MNDKQKHETIVWLLERFEDALMERTPSIGRSQRESVSLLPGPLWNEAFRELDRCLDRMRLRAAHDEIKLEDGGACSRRAARWHIMAWYVQTERRQVDIEVDVLDWQGRRTGRKIRCRRTDEGGGGIQIVRHKDARKPKADAGVSWLVSEYAWGSGAVQAALAALSKEPAGLRLVAA